MSEEVRSVLLMIGCGLAVAVAAAVPAGLCYLRLRCRGERIVPPARRWQVPWNGWAVLAGFFTYFLIPQLVSGVLEQSGFYQAVYGPDFAKTAAAGRPATPAEQSAATIRQLWVGLFAFPLLVPAIWLPLRVAYGDLPPRPLISRPAASIVAAYVGWLVLTPVVFGVFAAATWLWGLWTGRHPDPHPLTLLGPAEGALEKSLLVLEAVVFAPILEELLFRGALLPWLLQRSPTQGKQMNVSLPARRRPDLVVLAAVALPAPTDVGQMRRSFGALLVELAPILFMALLAGLYLWLPRTKRLGRLLRLGSARAGRAVWASAMLFAAFHSRVWPSPVPLFVLALGLGYVAVRMRGILAPILIHGTFNAVSVLYLLLGGR